MANHPAQRVPPVGWGWRESGEIMIFSYYHTPGNIGDFLCSPRLYIEEWKTKRAVYVHEAKNATKNEPIIFGGGGIFYRGAESSFDMANRMAPTIVWGAGTNHTPLEAAWTVPRCIKRFDLVGVRDYGQQYRYVPCASCLHPAFDLGYGEPEHEFVFYSHHFWPLPIEGNPHTTNDQRDMKTVLSFLAGGQCVITNSYHGAYWAMLLRRKVVLVIPNSNKFRFFKYPPPVASKINWKEVARDCQTTPHDFLAECRELNKSFLIDVKKLLP